MTNVFLSYSRKDRPSAKRLAMLLLDHGWSVWWDEQIRHGSTFDRVLEAQLREVQCIVVLWSRASVESDWVRAEAVVGLKRGNLVSVSLEPDLELPLRFTHIHTLGMYDLASSGEPENLHLLIRDIERVIVGHDAPAPRPQARPEPIVVRDRIARPAGRSRRWTWIYLAAVALLMAGIAGWMLRPPRDRVPEKDFDLGLETMGESDSEQIPTESPPSELELEDVIDSQAAGHSTAGSQWELLTSDAEWKPRYGHTTVSFRGKLWLIGGHEGTNSPGTYFNDVWVSGDGRSWSLVTDSAPWSARNFHTSVVHDNKLWVLGGVNTTLGQGYAAFNDIWYSEDGAEWTLATASAGWVPRWSHTSVVHNGRLWVLGGSAMQDHSSGSLLHSGSSEFVDGRQLWQGGLKDVWSSADGVVWQEVTSGAPWGHRWGHASVAYSGQIWVVGGYDGQRHLADVWYSGNGSNWRAAEMRAPWSARANHSVSVAGQRLWLIGGAHGDYSAGTLVDLSTVWFSRDGKRWEQPPGPAVGFRRRAFHSSATLGNKLFVLGGSPPTDSFESFNNEVWAMMQ